MKKILALVLALAMTLALVACGGKTEAPKTTEAPAAEAPTEAPAVETPAEPAELTGTLKVSLWDMATQPAFSAAIDAFVAANPGVTVEPIDVPSADYTTKLSVMLNGGSDLDVFWVKDANTLYELQERGQAADLNGLIDRDGLDLADYNGLADGFNFSGKQAALPFRTDYYTLFFNKDIFDAAGVEYPTNDMTWAEFDELARKVTFGEGTEKKYGAHYHTWQACVENWAVQDGKNTIVATDYSFFKPAYEMVLKQQEDGVCMDYGTLKSANLHYSSVFADGSVAMMPMGTWYSATIIDKINKGESSVNWGIATLPHPEGMPAGSVVGSTTPLCVNEASANKDLAWEFVKFVCGPEGALAVANTGAIPALLDDATLDVICSVPGMPEGAKEALAVTGFVLDRPIAPSVSEIDKMLGEEHSLIMLGEMGLDEVLAEMAERSAEIQEG